MTLRGLLIIGIIGGLSEFAEAGRICEGAPSEYIAEEIRGNIVDGETGKPIEGANVVAAWVLTGYGQTLAGIERLKIIEAVTDKKGSYRIAGWGSIKRPGDRCLWNEDPLLTIFKPGYYLKTLRNNHSGDSEDFSAEKSVNLLAAKIRKSRYNEEEIKLDRFVVGQEAEHLDFNTEQKTKRVTTERDWCFQILWVAGSADIFDPPHLERNAPFLKTFIAAVRNNLKEEREKGVDCGMEKLFSPRK